MNDSDGDSPSWNGEGALATRGSDGEWDASWHGDGATYDITWPWCARCLSANVHLFITIGRKVFCYRMLLTNLEKSFSRQKLQTSMEFKIGLNSDKPSNNKTFCPVLYLYRCLYSLSSKLILTDKSTNLNTSSYNVALKFICLFKTSSAHPLKSTFPLPQAKYLNFTPSLQGNNGLLFVEQNRSLPSEISASSYDANRPNIDYANRCSVFWQSVAAGRPADLSCRTYKAAYSGIRSYCNGYCNTTELESFSTYKCEIFICATQVFIRSQYAGS